MTGTPRVSRAGARRRRTGRVIAVDRGGTWLRVREAVDGRIRFRRRYPAPPLGDLPGFLSGTRDHRRRGKADRLILGSRGIWTLGERRKWADALKPVARVVSVMSDAELALHAALGARDEEGLLLAAGTGSIAIGRRRDGRLVRAGGGGPPKGDEGSGWWITRRYAARAKGKRFLTKSETGESVPATAAHAAAIIARAPRDPAAAAVVREAQRLLARLVLDVDDRLGLRGPVRLAWSGSLLGAAAFRNGVRRLIAEARPGRFRFEPRVRDAAGEAAAHPGAVPYRPPVSVPPRRRTGK